MISSYENSHYVPIFCDLKGRKVVIVGGGRVAERKVSSLIPSGADITLISPEVTERLSELAQKGAINHVKRAFEKGDLEGAWLVIAATDDGEVQREVFKEAERQRCFCNVVDQPERCSFIVPSLVKRGALSIAISTGGQSPGLARSLRKRLQEEFGQEWGVYVEIIGRLRRVILSEAEAPEGAKRLERLLDSRCLDWIREKEWEKLREWAIEICGKSGEKIIRDVIS